MLNAAQVESSSGFPSEQPSSNGPWQTRNLFLHFRPQTSGQALKGSMTSHVAVGTNLYVGARSNQFFKWTIPGLFIFPSLQENKCFLYKFPALGFKLKTSCVVCDRVFQLYHNYCSLNYKVWKLANFHFVLWNTLVILSLHILHL